MAAITASVRGLIVTEVAAGMASVRTELTKDFSFTDIVSGAAGKWSTELEGKVEQTFRNLHAAMHVSATHGTEWAACQAEALAGWRVMQN